MGDSDDEYDRRRARDKFRRERSDYNDRRREREDRSSRRDDWSERRRDPSWENRRRGDYREFERGRRDSSGRHHEMSPPMKRVRRDWDDPYHGGGDYSVPYGGVPAHHNTWAHPEVPQMPTPQQDARQQRLDLDQQQGPPQHAPAMMTFKQFLNAQDDNIGDEEAVKKYQEYKLEFRKTQMSDFFQQHKEEEWFRTKYHPKEAALRQKEVKKAMKKRLSVFLNLLKTGRGDNVSLDIDNAEAVIKLLDTVVLKLEGGTDDDLVVLDRPGTPPPPERGPSSSNPLMSPQDDDMAESSAEGKKKENVSQSTGPPLAGNNRKEDTIPETGPVSPSSVPLPSAPPPASVKAAASAKKKENDDVKVMSVPNPTPEQQQLQQQAQQYYHQQQLYYQQQYYASYDTQQGQYAKQYQQVQQQLPQTSQPQQQQPASQQPVTKNDEPKKKRKRRHREPYYYDAMDDDESESESDSDSEPEPAPPGEEMSPMETGKDEELLPPGVEAEAPSTEENLLPPGVDEPEVSQTETSVQLPTSSSNSEKHPTIEDENKPDSCQPTVGSSQPEMSTSRNEEVTEGGSCAVQTSSKPETSDDTAADSTQEPDDRDTKKTFQAETSCPDQAESSLSVQEKYSDEVGSTDNAVSMTKKATDVEMIPESSSEALEKQPEPTGYSQEPEPSSELDPSPPKQDQPEKQTPQEVDSNNVDEKNEDSNKIAEKKEVVEEESPAKPIVKERKEVDGEEKEKDTTENDEHKDADAVKELGELGPRALHKTFSLFMRSVPPNISKAEISVVCKRFAGYLRVALSDPTPDRKFFRRGWITFDRSVNIKEICWELNNIRVKDVELSPVVNRDLSRRVRPVAGVTTAKQVIRDDIKLAAKLIRVLDKRAALYEKESKEETEAREKAEKEAAEKTEEGEECEAKPADDSEIPDLPSDNPILASLSQDATEEEEGEEMELLGTAHGESEDKPEVDLSRDSGLMRVLDRLILYLRVVHSLDYYNGSDYPYEDEMPNRCGIIHVRGATPEKSTQAEVQDWQKSLTQKLEPFLQEKETLTDEEVIKLGRKDPEAETEKFVEANTQELAKDKWLCPLSGKKFRGPDFVRKHIFNKHMDKVDAVRMEAEFFNNYLSDPKRPQIPDAPANQRPPGNQMGQMYGHQHAQGMMGWGGPRPHMMMYGPRGHYTPPAYGGYGNEMYGRGQTYPPKPRRFGYGGGRSKPSERGFHRDPRQIVQYRDLDAPDDSDIF